MHICLCAYIYICMVILQKAHLNQPALFLSCSYVFPHLQDHGVTEDGACCHFQPSLQHTLLPYSLLCNAVVLSGKSQCVVWPQYPVITPFLNLSTILIKSHLNYNLNIPI